MVTPDGGAVGDPPAPIHSRAAKAKQTRGGEEATSPTVPMGACYHSGVEAAVPPLPVHEMENRKVLERPFQVGCLAPGNVEHRRVDVDANGIESTTGELDCHPTGATTRVEDAPHAEGRYETGLTVHIHSVARARHEGGVEVLTAGAARPKVHDSSQAPGRRMHAPLSLQPMFPHRRSARISHCLLHHSVGRVEAAGASPHRAGRTAWAWC